jgi:nicotinamidase/pyrazinamidase
MLVLFPPGRKFSETLCLGVDRTVKGPDRHFVIVACVDHGNIFAGNQVVPFSRVNIMPDARQRIDIGLTHRHDLALQADLHLAERRLGCGAFLPLKIGTAGQGPDVCDHGVNSGAGAGNRAVDPFASDQQRAFDVLRVAKRLQRCPQSVRIAEPREVVEGGNRVHERSITPAARAGQEGGCVRALFETDWQLTHPRTRPMNTALIVIDVQNDFCPGGALAVAGGDQIIEGINTLMPEFAAVVLTQDWHPSGHSSFASSHPDKTPYEMITMPYGLQVLWPDHCVQGKSGAAFHPALRTDAADLIIRKGYNPDIDSYSAFFENDHQTPTGLEGYLRTRKVTHLTMVGLALDFCVNYSAVDAAELGFDVTVDQNLCRAIDLDGSLNSALTGMKNAGVTVT